VNSSQLRTATAAATDVGRKRSGNEDSFALWVSDEMGGDHLVDTLLVVADGMGGSNAGEVASRMVVEAVVRDIAETQEADPAAALAHAVELANGEVYEHSRTRSDLSGMGTTCTVIGLKGDRLSLAHVGDSRAYLVRGGRIRQLTQDHSLVAQLVARKQLTLEQAKHDPRRNVVTRSVGVGPVVDVDSETLGEPLEAGDTLLLCSDGLHGLVSDDDLARLASGTSLDRACRELIALANQNGGPDNITVAMARLEGPDEYEEPPARSRAAAPVRDAEPARKPAKPAQPKSSRQRVLQLLIVAMVVLLLVVVGLVWVVFAKMKHAEHAQESMRAQAEAKEQLAWR
jgi:protein phosphatase